MLTCRAGCKELVVAKNRNAGPVSATFCSQARPCAFFLAFAEPLPESLFLRATIRLDDITGGEFKTANTQKTLAPLVDVHYVLTGVRFHQGPKFQPVPRSRVNPHTTTEDADAVRSHQEALDNIADGERLRVSKPNDIADDAASARNG
jgi:hypothetical protein